MQSPSASCKKCGIIISKYKTKGSAEPGRKYRVRESRVQIYSILSVVLPVLGVVLILFSGSIPIPLAGYVGGILLIASGVTTAFDKIKLKSYFVEISESGIASWNKKAIKWEDVESAQMKEYTYDRLPSVKTRWIEIMYFDKTKEEVVPIWFPSCLEDFDMLWGQIQTRIESTDARITTYGSKPKIDPKLEGFIYVMLLMVGFFLLLAGLFLSSEEEWFPYQSVLMMVLGMIIFGYTVVWIFSQVRKYRL
jgi:hypothetical protein